MERTLGWRHFEAVQKRGQGREAFVLLESTCDRDTKLWVSQRFFVSLPFRLEPTCDTATPSCG